MHKHLFSFLGNRSATEDVLRGGVATVVHDAEYPTKALAKFLKLLRTRDNPALVDLGPVVGSNVTFFGEQLGCRIRVEDIAADIERHTKSGSLGQLPAFFDARFPQPPESIDGVLCWDLFDFLDKKSATSLARSLTRVLKPEGALLAFFSSPDGRAQTYTKFVVASDTSLRHRPYPASQSRQKPLQNRDILNMFDGLRVAESFLMKNNVRELLLRKPAYLAGPPG